MTNVYLTLSNAEALAILELGTKTIHRTPELHSALFRLADETEAIGSTTLSSNINATWESTNCSECDCETNLIDVHDDQQLCKFCRDHA